MHMRYRCERIGYCISRGPREENMRLKICISFPEKANVGLGVIYCGS
jgi:hypothetical protein